MSQKDRPGPLRRTLTEMCEQAERDDPEVAAAARRYEETKDNLLRRGPGLAPEEIARIYDLSVPLETEREIVSSPSPPAGPPAGGDVTGR